MCLCECAFVERVRERVEFNSLSKLKETDQCIISQTLNMNWYMEKKKLKYFLSILTESGYENFYIPILKTDLTFHPWCLYGRDSWI